MGYALIRWSEESEPKLVANLGTGFGVAVDCPPEVVTSQVEVVVVAQDGKTIDSEAVVASHLACIPTGKGLVDVIVPLSGSALKVGGLVGKTVAPITSKKGRTNAELREEVVAWSKSRSSKAKQFDLGGFNPSDPSGPVGSWVCWVIRCDPKPELWFGGILNRLRRV